MVGHTGLGFILRIIIVTRGEVFALRHGLQVVGTGCFYVLLCLSCTHGNGSANLWYWFVGNDIFRVLVLWLCRFSI